METLLSRKALFAGMIALGGFAALWLAISPRDAPPLPAAESADQSVWAALAEASPSLRVTDSATMRMRREELLAMDAASARAWILGELDRGIDFPTGGDLALGRERRIEGWPSYRTYLLDMLHLVDPALAAEKSRELVAASGSPDEWAVALRNVALGDRSGDADDWLRARSAELLRNEAWRAEPSAGYLNAFDVIVHAGHVALAPELLELSDDRGNRAVRHAAFLALDRLAQAHAGEVLPLLAGAAESFPDSGLMVSNIMARTDVREPAQRQALEAYLLDPARTAEELDGFASVFPNANFHVSNNLLTETAAVAGAEIAERDLASLDVLWEWLQDERFALAHDALGVAYSRVRGFVGR